MRRCALDLMGMLQTMLVHTRDVIYVWRKKKSELNVERASLFMEKNEMKNSSRLWKIYAGDAQCNITHRHRERNSDYCGA